MTTLHSINSAIKAFLKWTTILAALLILIILLIKVGFGVKELLYPTPLPAPTESFGKLPQIFFPETSVAIPKRDLSYSIDTLSGKLPEFPDRIEVFKVEPYKPNLLALDRARKIVAIIDFNSKEENIGDSIYSWVENEPYERKIDYNILTSNFILSSNYFKDEAILNPDIPDPNEAIEASVSFFNTVSSFPNDVDTAKTKTSLFTIEENKLIEAASLSNTKIIRVDFFQKDVNNLPIFYEKPGQSNIYSLVGGNEYKKQIVEANFLHHNISSSSATYYIKKPEEAFTLLKKGQAFITDYKGEKKEISIKNVFLAYYLPKKEVEYLMPIIVFEGNDNFYAYISAIKTD